MVDTLAPKALIGVMTPAMNTVVQPELELLRPAGVTNQMQRFRLGGDAISDDLPAQAEMLMDCKPKVLAIGLTTDAGPGGVAKLAARTAGLEDMLGIPVCNASTADHEALRTLGAKRIAVATPFNDAVNEVVQANQEAAGFEVVAIAGTAAPSLPEICETPLEEIRALFRHLAESDCDAILQVGTALPVVALLGALEHELGKAIVACNAAVYWQALRRVGLNDRIEGYGRLLSDY